MAVKPYSQGGRMPTPQQQEPKSGLPAVPPSPPEPVDPLTAIIGHTVAFVIYPDEAIPAVVTAAHMHPQSSHPSLDLDITMHYVEVVDAGGALGMMAYATNERVAAESRANVRWNDPHRHLDPDTERVTHRPFPVPQPGHFTPGTWFDPSPWSVSLEIVINPMPEERSVTGVLRAAAKPGRVENRGPFADYTAAYAALRQARAEIAEAGRLRNETGSVRMVFVPKKAGAQGKAVA